MRMHCLNPPGHGIHQSCTGCCWDPLPLLHNDITELLDVRHMVLLMPHMCSVGFRSGDILSHSITFSSKAVVILAVCLGSLLCWKTPVWPSFWREGIIFCFRMSQYMLESMFPSMIRSSPVPAALMQPQTMMLPPPCLTVGKTQCSSNFTRASPHMLDTIWVKQVYLRLIRPQDIVPVIHAHGQGVFS